jgi:uncharacterized membrane protein YkvA (DUF1232 family)
MKLSKKQKDRLEQQAADVDQDDEDFVLDGYKAARAKAMDRGAAKSLLDDVKTLWRMLTDPDYSIPWTTWAWIISALVYFISPVDIIPDVIPGAGYIDDAAVVAWVVSLISDDIADFRAAN